jgi:hypothetical protein
VLEHNGSLSGTTVTWEPQIGEPNDMFARAMDSGGAGGGMPVWLWIVIGVVIVVIVLVTGHVLPFRGATLARSPGEIKYPRGV